MTTKPTPGRPGGEIWPLSETKWKNCFDSKKPPPCGGGFLLYQRFCRAAMNSGAVPQQPPRSVAPIFTQSAMMAANSAGDMG